MWLFLAVSWVGLQLVIMSCLKDAEQLPGFLERGSSCVKEGFSFAEFLSFSLIYHEAVILWSQ